MATAITDILIGSIEQLATQVFSITSGQVTITSDDYYLRSNNASLSLIDEVEAELLNTGANAPDVFIRRDLKVQINFGIAEAIGWGSATKLRNLLGFDGDSALSTSHVADHPSPLLWSPGYLGKFATIRGIDGYDVDDTTLTMSNTGNTVIGTNTSKSTLQNMDWDAVEIERIHTTSEFGGEFKRFRDEVLSNVFRFLLYQDITEDPSSGTEITFTAPLGPYKIRDYRQLNKWYKRKVSNADIWSPISLRAVNVAEYA